jgi:two-component system NtrC family sensor kinase
MTKKMKLSAYARWYAWSITIAGMGVGVWFIGRGDPLEWDWIPLAVFASLGALATLVSFNYQGFLPSRISHQTGSSFAYALFLLTNPGAAVLALWFIALVDWAVNRRFWLTAIFNLGQLSLAFAGAFAVRGWIVPGFRSLDGVDPLILSAAVISLVVFALLNHGLTHVAITLASGGSLLRIRSVQYSGVLNEALCIVTGIGMAIFWWIRPWLIPIGFLPLGVQILSLYQLSRRENEYVAQEAQLRSLQELGLEIGSLLDADQLHRTMVRVSTEALAASGSVLATTNGEQAGILRTVSAHGAEADLLTDPIEGGLVEAVMADGAVRLVENGGTGTVPCSGVGTLDAKGWLFAPLEILGERTALLIIFHRGERRPFDAEDVARLKTLVRFINVALSNSRLVSNLRDMQEQLIQTEKMSALGMLVSGVAHELNNPLTSVLGYADLLLRQEEDGRKREMLETVTGQADRARRIVRNLLTFSRKRKPEKSVTDINRILREILDLRSYDLRTGNIRLNRRLAADLPHALIDPHQFQQVFLNLITNAEHALTDRDRDRTIDVETVQTGESIRITVADNGPGIREKDLDKIFLPFFTTKETGRGTGLGLSICYGIVEEHGGRIRAEHSDSGGAKFVIEIPACLPEEEPAEPMVGAVAEDSGGTGHLLVVDDEEAITALVRDSLVPRGWEVTSASDGRRALEAVRRTGFDVLLVDLRMPGMDGPAFYRELLQIRPDLAARVVFATGDAGNPATRKFLEGTSSPVLTKPFTVRALLETIQRIL